LDEGKVGSVYSESRVPGGMLLSLKEKRLASASLLEIHSSDWLL